MLKKTLTLLLCLLLAVSSRVPCYAFWYSEPDGGYDIPSAVAAAAQTDSLSLDCRAALLMELETGSVIYERNADERMPEASITKVMTMLLVFEALDSGKIAMTDEVTCSEYAASMGGSQIWLEPGEVMTVHDLIKAAMVGSANDASVVLAEHVAGSHEAFVAMMNRRAAELHMDNTAYKNCTGLDAEGHVTSARDIAIVSAELMRHDGVFEFSKIWMDSLRGGETQLVNTNKLVRYYNGITGLKTGTTSQAGCCVAATAERDGMNLIAVVMGAPNSKTRFACASSLLDYGFASCELVRLDEMTVSTTDIPVIGGMTGSVGTYADMNGSILIPKGTRSSLEVNVSEAEDLTAPVEEGQVAGAVTVTLGGETVGVCDILTSRPCDEITFPRVFMLMLCRLIGFDDVQP